MLVGEVFQARDQPVGQDAEPAVSLVVKASQGGQSADTANGFPERVPAW